MPLAGATVQLTGSQTAMTTTSALGEYSFDDLPENGNYALTPVALGFTFAPLARQYNNLAGDITNANFVATPAPSRQVRIVGGSTSPTQDVTAVVELVAQGDENALGFSIAFDPAVLTYLSVSLNPDATSASLIENATQAASGKMGIVLALPAGTSFGAGTRSLITITFHTANTNQYVSPLIFGDLPTVREVANTNADPLPTNYVGGQVTFAQGWEADVAPRPTGNNNGTITVADFTQVGRFAAGLDSNYSLNEFQRADCAPRISLGNGAVTVSDYTQAGRYAASLDPATPAGGVAGLLEAYIFIETGKLQPWSFVPTPVRVVSAVSSPGQQVTVSIEADAQGGENGFGFTLDYVSSSLSNPQVTLGSGVPVGAALIPNVATSGKVGVILGLPFGTGLTPGTKQLITIRFDVAPNAPVGSLALTFGDTPVVREISDVNANILTSSFQDGVVTILTPTAANVDVGGRVADPSGLAISGVRVSMSGPDGVNRQTRTNQFGYYMFRDVQVGQTYLFNAGHKAYSFATIVSTINEATDGLNFVADP
jgi:hypothetical protein